MLNIRLFVTICMAALAAMPLRADGSAIAELFRSVLAQQDDSKLPKEQDVGLEFAGSVGNLTASEIETLLPFAERCLTSERRARQSYGVGFFSTVAVRMDGSQLLAPYIDEVARLLNDDREAFRSTAIFILGSSNPKPLPKGLAYLSAHLGDRIDTPEQFNLIAGYLLVATPDAATIHRVLAAARQRPDIELIRGHLIGLLSIAHARSDEGLAFIREGFANMNSGIRMAAIDAVSELPRDVIRSGFATELERIVANPEEAPELRDRARQVLIQ